MSEDTDMEREHCIKEAEIAAIKTELVDLTKIIKGNGLQKAVTELSLVVPQLSGTVKELSGNVQILLNRKIEGDTERKLQLSARQKMTAIIMGIISAAGVIVMIADMILKNKAG